MTPLVFTEDQKRAYKAEFAASASEEQFNLFIEECQRRALIPGVHVVFQLRKATEYNASLGRRVDVKKVTLITTINALRLIAERSGKFRGYGKFTYYYKPGPDGTTPFVESVIPLGKVPHAVSVELFRDQWAQPVLAVARYDAYVQMKQDGNKDVPTRMWRLRAEEQTAKCAEALGLRMVAPEECGGLYIAEEFEKEQKESAQPDEAVEPGSDSAAPATATPAIILPNPTVAPAVNQAPATTEPVVPAQATAAPAPPAAQPVKAAAPIKPAPRPAPRPTPAPAAVPHGAGAGAHSGNGSPVQPVPRQPNVDEPVRESAAELTEFADRVARDTYEGKVPEPTVPEVKAALATVAAAPVETIIAATEQPPTSPEQYKDFVQVRCAKIVRDKLEGVAKVKNAGQLVKEYLLRKSGKDKLNKITAAQFEELISALEKATAEEAAKIIKEK